VEGGGSLVVAGKAEPGSELSLLVDGKLSGGGRANASGEWVILPDEPLVPGSHEVVVEARDPAGSTTVSDQVVAVVVPDKPDQKPLVVLTEPSSPAKVLEKPSTPEATETPPSAPSKEQEVAVAPQPSDSAPPPRQPEPADSGAEAKPGERRTGPALQPAPQQQAAVAPKADAEVSSKAAEPSVEEPKVEEPKAEEPSSSKPRIPLSLETVDYNDEGDIVFSGRAEPGYTVRLYVDNRFIGEAAADPSGRWSFAGREQIASGPHNLRADRIDQTGKVLGRVELPFFRADSNQVAALIEARRKEEPKSVPQPQPEPQAEQKAEAPAPGPKPEAERQDSQPTPQSSTTVFEKPSSAPPPQPKTSARIEDEEPERTPQPQPAPKVEEKEPEAAPQPKTAARTEDEKPEPTPQPQPAPKVEEKLPEAVPQPQETAKVEEEPAAPAPTAVPPPDQNVAAAPAEPAEEPAAADAKADRQAPPAAGQVVIQPGNNLWRISRVIYGRGVQYTVIYEANRGHIRDPNLIYPGQIFATPGVKPPQEIDPRRRQPLTPEELEGGNGE
jgi:nucleoid-associated protein YgaU